MVEIQLARAHMMFHEGILLRYFETNENLPAKHQLLIEFADSSVLTASVQMYGGICCFLDGQCDDKYYLTAKAKPSPLTEGFDQEYFNQIVSLQSMQKKSVKVLLATEQRIPGLDDL